MKKNNTIIATGDNINGQSLIVCKGDRKLEKLNELQEGHMNKVSGFWLNYIFSCKNSINKEQAKIGIDWLYKFVGKDAPIIIFLDSPIACQFGYNV